MRIYIQDPHRLDLSITQPADSHNDARTADNRAARRVERRLWGSEMVHSAEVLSEEEERTRMLRLFSSLWIRGYPGHESAMSTIIQVSTLQNLILWISRASLISLNNLARVILLIRCDLLVSFLIKLLLYP